jgi:hypothetical protein
MGLTKGELSKVSRELTKYNIKSESILAAAAEKEKTPELVRLVLNGETPDKNNIIEFLVGCIIKEKNRLAKVSQKIDSL